MTNGEHDIAGHKQAANTATLEHTGAFVGGLGLARQEVDGDLALTDNLHYDFDPQVWELSARELLTVDERTRRAMVAEAVEQHVEERGLTSFTLIPNVADALPAAGEAAMERHSVPPEGYGGRMVGMALGFPLRETPVAVVSEPPFRAEAKFVETVAKYEGIESPTILGSEDEIGPDSFVYPFIGSARTAAAYGERSIPDSTPLNNKANIRQLLRASGHEDSIVPGVEVMYEPGESREDYYRRVVDAVRSESALIDGKVFLKHGTSASGFAMFKYAPEQLAEADDELVYTGLDAMFTDPRTGAVEYESVVVEDYVDFTNAENQVGDFCLRGFVTPDGKFVPLSAGRVVSDPEGECLGSVMAKSDDPEQLAQIGIHSETIGHAADAIEALVTEQRANGYYHFGGIGVDFFADQSNPDGRALLRDWNLREGSTTYSGNVASMSEEIWGRTTTVLDGEFKISSDDLLTEEQLEELLEHIYDAEVAPYATTFLRYPKVSEDGASYTLKVMAPLEGPTMTEQAVAESMQGIAAKLNATAAVHGTRFFSPL